MSKQDKINARRRAITPYPSLDEILNRKVLDKHLASGIVKANTHPTLPLWVYDYTSLCERRRKWDQVTITTRGLVRDNKGLVIARPFQRFVGWKSRSTSALRAVSFEDEFYAFEKLDGTMCTASNYQDQLLLSTRGSFDAWQLARVRALWPEGALPSPGHTWILEYVGPDNRVVVPYEQECLYALAVIDNWSGADLFEDLATIHESFFAAPVTYQAASPEELISQIPSNGQAEGMVLVWPRKKGPSGRMKLKHPDWIKAHHEIFAPAAPPTSPTKGDVAP